MDQLLSFLAPSAPSFRKHLLQRKDSSSKKIHRIKKEGGVSHPGEGMVQKDCCDCVWISVVHVNGVLIGMVREQLT